MREERGRLGQPMIDPREVCEELRSTAATTSDNIVRERLTLVCERMSRPRHAGRPTVVLAPRERDVLARIAIGKTNNEVA